MVRAFSFAIARAGKSKAARIEMMAITTSSSIKVNAERTRSRRALNGQALMSITMAGVSAGTLSFAIYQSAIKRQNDRFLCAETVLKPGQRNGTLGEME